MLKLFWMYKRRQHLKKFQRDLDQLKQAYQDEADAWADIGMILPIFVSGLVLKTNIDATSIMSISDLSLSDHMIVLYATEEHLKRNIGQKTEIEAMMLRLALLYYNFHYLQFLAKDQPDIMLHKTDVLTAKYHDFIMTIATEGAKKAEMLEEQEKAKQQPHH